MFSYCWAISDWHWKEVTAGLTCFFDLAFSSTYSALNCKKGEEEGKLMGQNKPDLLYHLTLSIFSTCIRFSPSARNWWTFSLAIPWAWRWWGCIFHDEVCQSYCHEKWSLSQIAPRQGLRCVPRSFKDKVNIKVKVNIYYRARLERQGCYWQTVLPQWGRGRLFGVSARFFYEHGHNSETKNLA